MTSQPQFGSSAESPNAGGERAGFRLAWARGGRGFWLAVALAWLAVSPSWAGPWLEPGEVQLRQDITLLADSGLIESPVTTWPIPWNEIARGLARPKRDLGGQPEYVQRAFRRVRARAAQETKTGKLRSILKVGGGYQPDNMTRIRTFADQPREDGEFSGGVEYTGDWFAYRIQGTLAVDPEDDEDARYDHSYVGIAVGGWSLSVDALDRWWGPSWDGQLLLSQNARPVPALTLQRNSARPFESKWLSWLGPWNLVLFNGVLEKDRDYANPYLFGARFAFKPPATGLEIGLARTSLWGGDGRPRSFADFIDVVGRSGNDEMNAEELASHRAAIDLRWASPFPTVPFSLYGQIGFEDEEGVSFSERRIYTAGLEHWGPLGERWDYRIRFEYSDTLAQGAGEQYPDVAYNHPSYVDGYRHYGRVMGHATDNDSIMRSAGLTLTAASGLSWQLLVRNADLNRDGGGINAVSATARGWWDLELSNRLALWAGQLDWGVAYQEVEESGGQSTTDPRGFLQWQRKY